MKITDYSKLPDGTLLLSRNGVAYVKGPHPTAAHVRSPSYAPTTFVAWQRDHVDEPHPNWQFFRPDGTCGDNGEEEPWDIVGLFAERRAEDLFR